MILQPLLRLSITVCVVLLITTGNAFAKPDDQGFSVSEATKTLTKLEKSVDDGLLTGEAVAATRQQVAGYRKSALECVDTQEADAKNINNNIEILGPADKDEDRAVTSARHTLETELAKLEKELSACKLLLVQTDSLLDKLDKLEGAQLSSLLKTRSPSIPSLLVNRSEPVQWLKTIKSIAIKRSGLEDLTPQSPHCQETPWSRHQGTRGCRRSVGRYGNRIRGIPGSLLTSCYRGNRLDDFLDNRFLERTPISSARNYQFCTTGLFLCGGCRPQSV